MSAKHRRVTRANDYKRVVRGGKRFVGKTCVVYAVTVPDTQTRTRFGFIVSRAVGNAVARNLVRRRLKTIVYRDLANDLGATDVVIRAFASAATVSFVTLEQDLQRVFRRVERNVAEVLMPEASLVQSLRIDR